MKKFVLFVAFLLSFVSMTAQKNLIWQEVGQEQTTKLVRFRNDLSPNGEQYFKLNVATMLQILTSATDKFSGSSGIEVSFPSLKGGFETFRVWENSNFEPGLQAKFPDIRAYVGKGITDKYATINFSVSPSGIQTMLLRADRSTEFIEAYDKEATVYALFNSSHRSLNRLPFNCSTADIQLQNDVVNSQVATNKSSNGLYKTMRLALSCTGEYGTFFGGVAGALAQMNTTMTRVNGILEKDLALHFNLISNNTSVIFTNALIDPYADAAPGGAATWNSELQSTLTSTIGEANYDIGHLFGATGGGGNAGCIGCVCVDGSKGSAFTSPGSGPPSGDNFDIDYVIHEMGHQLGGNHTFTFSAQGNNPGTLFSSSQLEPGSGTTIMAYAGITGPSTDVQPHSDALFSYRGITQIQNNLSTKTCPVTIPNSNSTPTSNAGLDWTIPKTTPFILTGVGTDADPNDILTYIWEENDLTTGTFATSALANATTFVSATKINGPNFRTFVPTTNPSRYLPKLTSVLAGQYTTPSNWECLNTNARTMKFVMTVRDNNVVGQTQSDEMIVTVSNTRGPFTVTSQNTSGLSWTQGTTETITWNVASTNLLVGSTNVDITLSTDGGLTFPTILAANVPNNGSATVTVPNVLASSCRILVKPTGNIYYNVNSTSFAIIGSLANQEFNLNNFSLYPNPNTGNFNLRFTSNSSNDIKVSVNDMRGRLVYDNSFQNSGVFNQEINLNKVQAGVYLVTVTDGEFKTTKRIIVE